MTAWHDAAACADIADESVIGVAVEGRPIALFKIDDGYYALRDLCTHGQARLSEGYVENGCVECPLHQGLVDIRTGAPRSAPITVAVKSYPVRIVADRVEVEF